MPFITDESWTPSTYRLALARWQQNAPPLDSKVLPRKAAAQAKPRHAALADRLRVLLTWRSITSGSDWTAANDNRSEATSELIDSKCEIRPRVQDMIVAIRNVTFAEQQHAKLGGGGEVNVIPTGGDIAREAIWPAALRRKQNPALCITRLGSLEFSNGGKTEPALVRDAVGKIVRGSIRIPLGGLTRFGNFKPRDRFKGAKGADNDNLPPANVGVGGIASHGAFEFVDPVADAQEARRVRTAVTPATAQILDFALVASSFSEIGERLGFQGKTAERQGKTHLLKACEELENALAA